MSQIKKPIVFIPHKKSASLIKQHPKPAKNFIPKWYKDITRLENGDKKLTWPSNYQSPNLTLKTCVPFLEALSNGYMVYLSDDIFVEHVDGVPFLRWHQSDDGLVSGHGPDQFPLDNIPFSDIFFQTPFKFMQDWEIKVPKGYSVMFSHPHNRIDLPFYTFSGLVNCDVYDMPVQFPFLLRKDFEGIIKAGTPISQLTIIKNESWESDVQEYDEDSTYIKRRNFYKHIHNAYRNYFWKKDNHFD